MKTAQGMGRVEKRVRRPNSRVTGPEWVVSLDVCWVQGLVTGT
uniref:Uncharacterized protein n=1 Tax=Arundo donax TaxID=35708 RepID=A0A0A9A679_ARUDO